MPIPSSPQPFLHKPYSLKLPNLRNIKRPPHLPKNNPAPIPQSPPSSPAPTSPQPFLHKPLTKPLPNLQNLKPLTNPIPEPPPTSPKVAPINATAPIVGAGLSKFALVTAEGTATALAAPVLLTPIAAAIWFHNAQELLKLWQLSQAESGFTSKVEIGQANTDYKVEIQIGNPAAISTDPSFKGRLGPYSVRGPIGDFIDKNGVSFLTSGGADSFSITPISSVAELMPQFISVKRVDSGKEEVNQPLQRQFEPQRIPSLSSQPLNLSPNQPQKQLNNSPEGLPFAEPTPETKKQPIKFAVPSDQPIQISAPGQPTIQIASSLDPQTRNQPTRIVIPTNTPTGQPQPVQVTSPSGTPTTFSAPASSPITINIPGQKPITYTPGQGQPANTIKPIQKPDTLVPESVAQPSIPIQQIKPIGSPAAGLQVESRPKIVPTPETTGTNNKGQPVIFTPPTPSAQPAPTTPSPILPMPDPAIAIIAGLTPILQQLIRQTSTPAIAEAVCTTTQPGSCTSNLVNNAANNVNQNTNRNADILGGVNAAQNAEQLRRLDDITDRLGDPVPGGLSGFLTRAFRATRLDKILNALTFITTLHNAAMLSRSLGSTLGDLTGQALSVIGIKDENGGALDINAEISSQVNNLLSTILGAETWAGTKTAWNKANTIISSASQIVYTVRSIADSGREVTEWIANNTGKIGNALKRFRIVGEDAYPHMSENVTHQNAWMLKVQRYREGVDSLDDAASSLQGVLGEVGNIQQEFGELNEQKQRFDKAVTDAQPKTIPDNTPVKIQRETALAVSKAPADAATVFRGEGETPDA